MKQAYIIPQNASQARFKPVAKCFVRVCACAWVWFILWFYQNIRHQECYDTFIS